ncbi:MAG: hypothetical protein GY841_01535, partial [FCB group bacterium]|nr:hypothetical protein [FCB group bacterium]
IPTFRPDITREFDLIEEVARIYGLDEIPVSHRNGGPLFSPIHRRDTIKNDMRKIMTGFGFEEALGTGFAHPERQARIDSTIDPIKVLNPLSDEFGVMRSRMLYSLLASGGNNIRHRNIDFKLFEIGRVYRQNGKESSEPEYLGLIMTGKPEGTYWKTKPVPGDFYEIKGILAALADSLSVDMPQLVAAPMPGYDPSQSYQIVCGEHCLGHIGRVDRRVGRVFDIKQDCFAAELELSGFIDLQKDLKRFQSLPKYPASSRDIAVIVDQSVTAAALLEEINVSGGPLMESVEVFDLFTGDPVPEGKKSLAFSVSYRSSEKTLAEQEVDEVHNRIIDHIKGKFEARLRE